MANVIVKEWAESGQSKISTALNLTNLVWADPLRPHAVGSVLSDDLLSRGYSVSVLPTTRLRDGCATDTPWGICLLEHDHVIYEPVIVETR